MSGHLTKTPLLTIKLDGLRFPPFVCSPRQSRLSKDVPLHSTRFYDSGRAKTEANTSCPVCRHGDRTPPPVCPTDRRRPIRRVYLARIGSLLRGPAARLVVDRDDSRWRGGCTFDELARLRVPPFVRVPSAPLQAGEKCTIRSLLPPDKFSFLIPPSTTLRLATGLHVRRYRKLDHTPLPTVTHTHTHTHQQNPRGGLNSIANPKPGTRLPNKISTSPESEQPPSKLPPTGTGLAPPRFRIADGDGPSRVPSTQSGLRDEHESRRSERRRDKERRR
ncbi:unnamed protein product [Protopolystoma xenopodis]|uniref:Uncharacterized protein n=1 Tax=Protopolystoma xenopodis TaxID=117903 RepID=A0A3S5B6K0_9PLAT|nr:unnamed protein product [Protopolystoma xenopodis]